MKEHILRAFELVSKIPVSGGNVDLMAVVRNELRLAYDEAERAEEKETDCHANAAALARNDSEGEELNG